MTGRGRHRTRGSAMADLAAAIAVFLPVAIGVGFVAFEASQVYTVKTTLDFAAETAARRLAIAYGENSVNAMAFPEKVFDEIRHAGIVVSSDQFTIPEGTAGWSTTTNPPTVRVNVVFQGGKYGLPPFPNPDPLGIGNTFSVTAVGIARLE